MSFLDEYRRGTLFSRTTLTITLVTTAFLLFTLTILAIFVIVPTAQRSAHEMASLVLLSAEALHRVEPGKREQFKQHLYNAYELDLSTPPGELSHYQRHAPFFLLLEEAFRERIGTQVQILQTNIPGEENHYWAKLDNGGKPLFIGFEYSHKWLDPPYIVLIIVVVGLFATFVTGITLARRLTHPLKQLALTTRQLGSGENVEVLPETGPLELRELVASFNRMSQQIHDLLANRTTLLAGISHDLRTPLTRMELAIEMLQEKPDPSLLAQLHRDIGHMNRLLGQFLEVSRGLQEGSNVMVDIAQLLAEIASDYQTTDNRLSYQAHAACRKNINPLALKRIIVNLIDNALRYSGDRVELNCRDQRENDQGNAIIEVRDHGPGIPQSERKAVFRPFYRLEQSRSSATGGSGLGLSIVKQLAEANGCQVELLSREGGGTIARLILPAVEE